MGKTNIVKECLRDNWIKQYFNMGIVYNSANKIFTGENLIDVPSCSSETLPPLLYKYFSFPKSRREINKRMRQIANRRLWFSSRKLMNDPKDLMTINTDLLSEDEKNYYVQVVDEKIYFCLCQDPTNVLMWAHYAKSFSGLSLGFRYNQNYDFPKIKSVSYQPRNFVEEYKKFYEMKCNDVIKTLVTGTLADTMLFSVQHFEEHIWLQKLNEMILYTKTAEWSYEKEYRLVLSASKFTKKSKISGKLIEADSVGLEIAEITIGLSCSEKNRKRVIKVWRKLNRGSASPIRLFELKYEGDKLTRKEQSNLYK